MVKIKKAKPMLKKMEASEGKKWSKIKAKVLRVKNSHREKIKNLPVRLKEPGSKRAKKLSLLPKLSYQFQLLLLIFFFD